MNKRLVDESGEVRELSPKDMQAFKPARDVLPAALQKTLGVKTRGPQKKPLKVSTTIRLSPDVLNAFRESGDGWQSRMDLALKDWLKTHKPVQAV
jgi:uncharacterized protein (DUF4415 family)